MGVERRLARNQRLFRELQAGQKTVLDPVEQVQTIAVPLKSGLLLEYASWIAKGLLYFRWQERVPDGCVVRSVVPTPQGDSLLVANMFQKFRGNEYQGRLANGALALQSLTSPSEPLISIWRFMFFEGLTVVQSDVGAATFIWSFIGPADTTEELANEFS